MRKITFVGSLAVVALALGMGGCESMPMDHSMQHMNMWAGVHGAVAVVMPTKGNTASGTIKFEQVSDQVHVWGEIHGLSANTTHGFHIHEFGDGSSDDGAAAGGHYNPEGHKHGAMMDAEHHAGDLGNITADNTGMAKVDVMVKGISIAGMTDPIIGRAVVVHGNADDLKSQPAGNAGPRIAVGVIGIAK